MKTLRLVILISLFFLSSCVVKKLDEELLLIKIIPYGSLDPKGPEGFIMTLNSSGMLYDELGHYFKLEEIERILFDIRNEYIYINLQIGSGKEDEKIPFSVVGNTLNDFKKISKKKNRKIIVYIHTQRIEGD